MQYMTRAKQQAAWPKWREVEESLQILDHQSEFPHAYLHTLHKKIIVCQYWDLTPGCHGILMIKFECLFPTLVAKVMVQFMGYI